MKGIPKNSKRAIGVAFLALAVCAAIVAGVMLILCGRSVEHDGLLQNSRVSITDTEVVEGVLFYTVKNSTPKRLPALSAPVFQKKVNGEWVDITYEQPLYPSSEPVPKYASFSSITCTRELREEERVPGEYRFYLSTYDGQNGVSVEERFFIVGYYTIKE